MIADGPTGGVIQVRASSSVVLKLMIVAVLAAIVAHAASALVLAGSGLRYASDEAERRLQTLLTSRADLLAGPLWRLQYEELDAILGDLIKEPAIVSASVYDDTGSRVRHRARDGRRARPEFLKEVTKPIVYQSGTKPTGAGRLVVTLSREPMADVFNNRVIEAVIVALISAGAIVFAIGFASTRIIGRPLALMMTAIEETKLGHGRKQVPWGGRDQFGIVIQAFNAMQVSTETSERALRLANQRLAELVCHDELTGLANRRGVNEFLMKYNEAEHGPARLTAYFIDLDGFKSLNDTLGHSAGDALLQIVASRLQDVAGQSGLVARLGGDEFIVLRDETAGGPPLPPPHLFLAAVQAPFTVAGNGLTMTCGASIGVARTDDVDCAPADLMAMADIALYDAKRHGRGTVATLTPQMRDDYLHRRIFEQSLVAAIENDEMLLHFQPQFDTRTGNIYGVEALVRWNHPTRGIVSPAEFLPVIEDLGLSVPLGNWIIRNACAGAAELWEILGRKLRISVNLSLAQTMDANLLDTVMAEASRNGLDTRTIELEITEGSLIRHHAAAGTILTTLRDHGVRIALDDFGTGYSSLAYLRQFKIDTLKLDRAFVAGINESQASLAIIRAIRDLSRCLNVDIVAEGVETLAQLELLRQEDIHHVQGFYYTTPLPLADLLLRIERLDAGRHHGDPSALRAVS